MAKVKEAILTICEDCGKEFYAKHARICPECHKVRVRKYARERNLNKLGNDAYSKQQAKRGGLTMATCKECLHHDACKKLLIASFPTIPAAEIEKVTNRECDCKTFKQAADVVEVVRCKDCQHYIDRRCYVGNRKPLFTYDVNIHSRKPNDFCSYGERKTK